MRTIRSALVSAAVALIVGAAPASARLVGPGHQTSWGKEGVSLEDYWIDSGQCSLRAYGVDLTGTAPARALIIASRMAENPATLEDAQRAMQFANPELQWDRAAKIMETELEMCLVERGYVKFRLTDRQADELEHLEKGSLERRRYLHSLASDPAVLAAQRVAES
jgi:hypothetical protein